MWFDNPVLKNIEKINSLQKDIINSSLLDAVKTINQSQTILQNMVATLTAPAFQSTLSEATQITQIISQNDILKNIAVSALGTISIKPAVLEMIQDYTDLISKTNINKQLISSATDLLKSYTSIADRVLTHTVTEALKSLTKIDLDLLKTYAVGVSQVELYGDSISIDDESFTVEEIQEDIIDATKQLSKGVTVKNIGAAAKKKFMTLIVFLEIMLALYGTVGMLKDVNENFVAPIVCKLQDNTEIEYVKVEKAYIREEPNPKAKNICEILYAEQVEVIEEIKFWRKVKYCANGKEIIGWISKISIGTEEEIQ